MFPPLGEEKSARYLLRYLDLTWLTSPHIDTLQPSISVDIVKMQKQESLSDGLAAYIAGQILQAGSETTAGIVVGFIQAMVIFPEVAKMAQEELDRVCGRDRLPDLNDVPHLPYIRACAKECFRWMPGLLLGVPHAVTKEDSYMGYRIPKGATVIMNVWYVTLIRQSPMKCQ